MLLHLEHQFYKQHRSDVKFSFYQMELLSGATNEFQKPKMGVCQISPTFPRWIFGQLHGQRFTR